MMELFFIQLVVQNHWYLLAVLHVILDIILQLEVFHVQFALLVHIPLWLEVLHAPYAQLEPTLQQQEQLLLILAQHVMQENTAQLQVPPRLPVAKTVLLGPILHLPQASVCAPVVQLESILHQPARPQMLHA